MKKKIISLGMVAVLMLGLLGCGKYVNIWGQKLTSYKYSHGGGMTGGYGAVEVATVAGEVCLIYRSADTYATDASVTEYAVDPAIMDDIQEVFKKYRMSGWNQRKFTNSFVADGENYSYEFYFENDERVYFSSQIYPQRYRDKLSEFDVIINKYRESATLLPGLVVEEKSTDHDFVKKPREGIMEIVVYEYCKGNIYYRVLNGTKETRDVSYSATLVDDADGSVLFSRESSSCYSVSANSYNEYSFKVDTRLGEGTYTLHVGEYECKFMIK